MSQESSENQQQKEKLYYTLGKRERKEMNKHKPEAEGGF
jgi:hypothetical protein